jgi:hypothetical protein
MGVEVGAVVKFDPLAQMEDSRRSVDFVDLPAGGKARCQIGRLIGVLEAQLTSPS